MAGSSEERATSQQAQQDQRASSSSSASSPQGQDSSAKHAALLALSKRVQAIFNKDKGRGRVIGLEDRQPLAQDIEEAQEAGARLEPGLQEGRHQRGHAAALES